MAVDYPQREGDGPADATSIVEAVDNGYWYSVLAPGQRRVFAYLTDSDSLTSRQMRDSDFVATALAETTHVASLLDECTRDDVEEVTMRVRAATSSRLPSVAGDGWFAVGDAAMTFDPICSQGIYTAMRLGLEAARAITAGSSDARLQYEDFADRAWRDYLDSLRECYTDVHSEQVDPTASFWERRQPQRIARLSRSSGFEVS